MLRVGGWANIQVVDVSQDILMRGRGMNKTIKRWKQTMKGIHCASFFGLEKVGKRQNASKFESLSISVTLLGRLLWPQQYLSYFTVSVYSPIHRQSEIQFGEGSMFFERLLEHSFPVDRWDDADGA